jgi:hypothetical protein
MARKRYQKGQLWLEKDGWYGRWREDVIVNGVRQRPRRQGLIGTLKDYPTKRLAQRALDERIAHVNKISYRPLSIRCPFSPALADTEADPPQPPLVRSSLPWYLLTCLEAPAQLAQTRTHAEKVYSRCA